MRNFAKLYSSPLSEDDFASWENEIDQNCNQDKHKFFVLKTAPYEVQGKKKWVVKTEVLAATCGQPHNVGFQIFGWAAWKDGSYKAGQYSEANGITVSKMVKRWMFANMNSMVDCQRESLSECANFEDSELRESSLEEKVKIHVSSNDRWVEHANGELSASALRVKEESHSLDEAKSDKKVWNVAVEKKSSEDSN